MCATTTACKPMYEKQLNRLQLSVAISTSWGRRPSVFESFYLFYPLKQYSHIATVLSHPFAAMSYRPTRIKLPHLFSEVPNISAK